MKLPIKAIEGIKQWLGMPLRKKDRFCPFREVRECGCVLCHKIFPECKRTQLCPCHELGEEEVTKRFKKLVAEAE